MICIHIPSFPSIESALDWIGEHYGRPDRILLTRGYDGLVRGTVMVRREMGEAT